MFRNMAERCWEGKSRRDAELRLHPPPRSLLTRNGRDEKARVGMFFPFTAQSLLAVPKQINNGEV